MEVLKVILILGLIIIDVVFLIMYYQYNEENEIESVAQPIQMILILFGLATTFFSDFHWISILFLCITILVAFQQNYTKLHQTKIALVFTLWQTLCIVSVILVVLTIIVMLMPTDSKRKRKGIKIKNKINH